MDKQQALSTFMLSYGILMVTLFVVTMASLLMSLMGHLDYFFTLYVGLSLIVSVIIGYFLDKKFDKMWSNLYVEKQKAS